MANLNQLKKEVASLITKLKQKDSSRAQEQMLIAMMMLLNFQRDFIMKRLLKSFLRSQECTDEILLHSPIQLPLKKEDY